MNAFVIAYRSAGIPDGTLDRMRAGLAVAEPWSPLPERVEWTSPDGGAALAAAAHAPDRLGGVGYWWTGEEGMSLFAGRPFTWRDAGHADGLSALDPRFFARPAREWAEIVDGRFAAARYDSARQTLEIFADPFGMYPLYVRELDGVRYVSNQARALEALGGAPDWRPDVIATLVEAGWSISGAPAWQGIDRMPRGTLEICSPEGVTSVGISTTAQVVEHLSEQAFDAEIARTLIEEGLRASFDWPGRPTRVPLTAGKDSRVVLEAGLRRGVELSAYTLAFGHEPGFPETEDMRVARAIAHERGVAHESDEVTWPGWRVGTRPDGIGLLGALGAGIVPLNDVQAMRWPGNDGVVPIVAKGFGGEVARGFYGHPSDGQDPTDHLLGQIARRWPPSLLTKEGRGLLRDSVAARVEAAAAAGAERADVPDVVYFESRITGWGASSIAIQEHVEDTVAPMCSVRLLPHLLGLPRADRRAERFHKDVLAGYGVVPTTPTIAPSLAHTARRAATELSRLARPTRSFPTQRDPLRHLRDMARREIGNVERPELWSVVDRRRARALLALDPARMDVRARLSANRVATAILLAGPQQAAPAA